MTLLGLDIKDTQNLKRGMEKERKMENSYLKINPQFLHFLGT